MSPRVLRVLLVLSGAILAGCGRNVKSLCETLDEQCSEFSNYACVDAVSGSATCAGPVSSGEPLDTSTAGKKAFVVTATDAAGNTTTSTTHYFVANGKPSLSAGNPVAATVTVGNSPYGVAVNTSTQYVYVTNHASNTVSVLDGNSQRPTFNTVVATIGGFWAPRDCRLARGLDAAVRLALE